MECRPELDASSPIVWQKRKRMRRNYIASSQFSFSRSFSSSFKPWARSSPISFLVKATICALLCILHLGAEIPFSFDASSPAQNLMLPSIVFAIGGGNTMSELSSNEIHGSRKSIHLRQGIGIASSSYPARNKSAKSLSENSGGPHFFTVDQQASQEGGKTYRRRIHSINGNGSGASATLSYKASGAGREGMNEGARDNDYGNGGEGVVADAFLENEAGTLPFGNAAMGDLPAPLPVSLPSLAPPLLSSLPDPSAAPPVTLLTNMFSSSPSAAASSEHSSIMSEGMSSGNVSNVGKATDQLGSGSGTAFDTSPSMNGGNRSSRDIFSHLDSQTAPTVALQAVETPLPLNEVPPVLPAVGGLTPPSPTPIPSQTLPSPAPLPTPISTQPTPLSPPPPPLGAPPPPLGAPVPPLGTPAAPPGAPAPPPGAPAPPSGPPAPPSGAPAPPLGAPAPPPGAPPLVGAGAPLGAPSPTQQLTGQEPGGNGAGSLGVASSGSGNGTKELASSTTKKDVPIDSFCFDNCRCWPIWSSSILLYVIYIGITFIAVLMTANLFSKGLWSSTFYKGGGYWILGSGYSGMIVGGLVGGLVTWCVAGGLIMAGGMLALSTSVVLVGRRGAWLGAMGGLATGAIIGVMSKSGGLGVGLGVSLGFLVGLIVGFAPFARSLKINDRYIRKGLAAAQNPRRFSSISSNGVDQREASDDGVRGSDTERGGRSPSFVVANSAMMKRGTRSIASVDDSPISPRMSARKSLTGGNESGYSTGKEEDLKVSGNEASAGVRGGVRGGLRNSLRGGLRGSAKGITAETAGAAEPGSGGDGGAPSA